MVRGRTFFCWRKLRCRFKSRRGYFNFFFLSSYFYPLAFYCLFFLLTLLASRDFCENVFLVFCFGRDHVPYHIVSLNREYLGGVYMTPGRLSPRSEFTPVPSHGSIFVYMIPPQNVVPARVTPAWVHPGSCIGARISLWYEISHRYHVNAKRPPVSVWNRSAGRLERVAHA